ncbi:putative mediator of RNA polymerase II transcription subunit 15 [Rhagoletis pomonella]|uniref:putative mediator of RNA polymerase II transcription subunit 15 n=1 Tax=Rhagoletis pomonella TaxID=28610 RepID=UPI00177B78B0|nr:putative mediator of RNA polymerase II transcription subunit 15 [Rhagoletis pomonella]
MRFLFLYTCALLALSTNAAPNFGYYYERNINTNTNSNSNNNSFRAKDNNNENFFNPAPNSNALLLPQHHQTLRQQLQSQQQQQQQQHKASQQSYSGDKYLPPSQPAVEPIITKQFFLVSAPEESEEQTRTKHIVIGRPQKNYRVVFIKAPSPENANLKLTAEYAPQEEKTVIYVLSKKANELNIDEISTPAPTQPTKPEIFFIKYKTPEEAAAAQKEIQEQYDNLGGTSEFSDEGVAPSKSVVGSLDGLAASGGYDYRKVQNGGDSPIKTFLQPARFYF